MKPKVLILIDWFYPAYKAGGPIRSVANLVQHLHTDFELFILTSNRDIDGEEDLKVEKNTWIQQEIYSICYLDSTSQTPEKYKQIFSEIQPDFYYLNSLFSAKFTILPLKVIADKSKVVLAPRGMLGANSLKIKPLKKKLFFVYAKLTSLFKGITWQATTRGEQKEIQKVFPKAKIKIASNLPFLPKLEEEQKELKLKLITVGRVVPIKNILFLLEVLQDVDFDLELTIAGPIEDKEYWNKCKAVIDTYSNNLVVNILGEVPPHELEEVYKKQNFYISPTLNENFGHGIVEALGYGLPAIISDKTPWNDLDETGAGWVINLNKTLFLERVKQLNELSQEEYDQHSAAARKYAEQLIQPEAIEASKRLFKK